MDLAPRKPATTMQLAAHCIYCALRVFGAARQIGDVQVAIIENHVLLCRPLEPVEQFTDLLRHFRIVRTDL